MPPPKPAVAAIATRAPNGRPGWLTAQASSRHGMSSNAAEAIAHRIGRAADDFEVRVFVGAMVGAMMAAFDSAPKTADTIYRALDFMDAGMPLA